jgi:hypothetical protein
MYHSPQVLGLPLKGQDAHGRSQVALSDLMWVLDPTVCYPAVFGGDNPWFLRLWDLEQDPHAKRCFAAQKVLARYCLNQVLLMGEMCLDRSLNCIEAVEKEWKVDLILSSLFDRRLPAELRAAFVNLAVNLYVDRPPYTIIQVPQAVRVMHDFLGPCDLLELPSQPDAAQYFEALEAAVVMHFDEMQGCQMYEARGQNSLTLALAGLAKKLIKLGFLGNIQALRRICGPIAEVLDGRPDQIRDEQTALTHKYQRMINRKLASRSASKPRPSGSKMFASDGGQQTQVQVHPFAPVSDSDIIIPVKDLRDTATASGPVYIKPPLMNLSDEVSVVSGKSEQKLHFSPPELRYAMNDNSLVVMKCKEEMADVLQNMVTLGTDYFGKAIVQMFLSNRIKLFRDQAVLRELPSWIVQDVIKFIRKDDHFKIESLSQIKVNTTLADLIMYESDDLLERSLALLHSANSQMAFALQSLSTVQIIRSDSARELNAEVRICVRALESLLMSHEQWGFSNVFGDIGHAQIGECCDILIRLRQLLSKSGSEQDAGAGEGQDTAIPDPIVQGICHSSGLVQILFEAFRIPCGDRIYQSEEVSDKILHRILSEASLLLMQLVRDHSQNQRHVYQHLRTLLGHLPQRVNVEFVVAEIFRGNRELCDEMPDYVLDQILEYFDEVGYMPALIDTLDAGLSMDTEVCLCVKHKLVDFLENISKCNLILGPLLSLMSGPEKRGVTLAERIRGWSGDKDLAMPLECFRRMTPYDTELMCALRGLELCAHLCIGRDPLVEALVQSLFSDKSLVLLFVELHRIQASPDSTGSTWIIWELKRGVLYLLLHFYMDS